VRRLALGFAFLLALGTSARAEVTRYALILGANSGDPGEVVLRYAEADAQRIGRVLLAVGGFHSEDVLTLTDVRAEDVRRALIGLNARIRQAGGEALLFVFYSGHADAENLHLGGTRLPTGELRGLVVGSAAAARVLVLDACRSGALTRVKGGRQGPNFDIRIDPPLGAQGLAILTSSAAGEDSQESDQLGASFFTHYLASAFLGAADRDQDGRVTLGEAFAYASERTLNATAGTVAGPQHPTYRLDLGGRDDLVLTRPGAQRQSFGLLEFPVAGSYLVRRGPEDGPVVAELATEDPGRRLTLEAGHYHVTQRARDHLLEGEFVVLTNTATRVRPEQMRKVDYARVVRKGGTERAFALSLFASAGVRGDMLDLGPAFRTELGGRVDLTALSLELHLGFSQFQHMIARSSLNSREVTASAVGLRAFDVAGFTLGLGIEVGAAWFENLEANDTSSAGLFLGPVAQLLIPLVWRLDLRLDGGLTTYLLESGATPVSYRAGAGLALYF